MSVPAASKSTARIARWAPRRPLRLGFAGQVLSFFGDGMVPVIIPAAVLGTGGSGLEVSIVLSAALVGQLCALGIATIRPSPRRRVRAMTIADGVRLLGQAALGAVVLTTTAPIALLAVAQLACGAAAGVFRPAGFSLVPAIVDADRLRGANAALTAGERSGEVMGGAVAGAALTVISPGVLLLFDAATFAASIVTLRPLTAFEPPPPSTLAETGRSHVRAAVTAIRTRRWLAAGLTQASLALCLVVGPLYALGPVVASDDLGGIGAWGGLLAALALGRTVGSAAAARLPRIGPARALLFVPLTACLPICLGFGVPLAADLAAALISGAALGLFDTAWWTALQSDVPEALVGSVFALESVVALLLLPAGLIGAGVLSHAVAPATIIGFSALPAAGLPLVAAFASRHPADRGPHR
jgi:hypothetical protein